MQHLRKITESTNRFSMDSEIKKKTETYVHFIFRLIAHTVSEQKNFDVPLLHQGGKTKDSNPSI